MRRQRRAHPPRLTRALILKWVKVHFRRTGRWPTVGSGRVLGEPGEKWSAIDNCLRKGFRGLPGGSSLARLQAEAGLRRHRHEPPALTVEEILAWAEADRRVTGKWPGQRSGPVRMAPGKKWATIISYFRSGSGGLSRGGSLGGLLRLYRSILLRARCLLPVSDGERTITTPAQLTALLVSRGALQEPDLLESLRERQRKFQQAARGAASKR